MLDYKDITTADFGMYWHGCIVFRKEDGMPHYVQSDDDQIVLTREEGGQFKRHSVERKEFFKNYDVHRPRMGWCNIKDRCVYLSTYGQRGVRKAYRVEDLQVYDPIRPLLKRTTEEVLKDRDYIIEYEGLNAFVERYNKARTKPVETDTYVLGQESDIKSSLSMLKNLNYYDENYYEVRKALTSHDNLPYYGKAICPQVALLVTNNSPENGANIFYHTKEVGFVASDMFVVYENFVEAEPEIRRLCNV